MSDPQRCEGGPAALAAVAAWMHPCVCGHELILHDLTKRRSGMEVRTGCSVATAKGRCGCTLYKPAEEAT